MKNNSKKKLDKFWIFIGLSLAFILIGSFLSVQVITGKAVSTKKISQSTSLIKSGKLSTKTSSETPVQNLPQPSPPPRPEEESQCTTCGKQYEYRAMQGICGGTVDDGYSNRDPGLDLTCSRTDGYNEHRYTDGVYSFDMYAKAKCAEPYNWIVSYGAECPYHSTMTKIGPTSGAMVLDADSWSPMPLVGEVEARCKRISALPSEVDDAVMKIWITCMREKTR